MQFVTPTRRWALNYYITQCTRNSISWRQDAVEKTSTQQREPSGPQLISWGSDELVIRCGRENQLPERLGPQAPGWAAQENGKETRLWSIEWGSKRCSSVRSPTPSHTQPFQIKWEVYFSKNCVARLYCVTVMILHAYVFVLLVMALQQYDVFYPVVMNCFWKAGRISPFRQIVHVLIRKVHSWV